MVYLVILALLSAWLCWWIAVRKGRRGTGWFLVGLILGPLAIIAQLVLFKIQNGSDKDDINQMSALKSSIANGERSRVVELLAVRQWSESELSYLAELADLNGQPAIKSLIEQKARGEG
ncbi:hypothetical protein HMF8227_00252 [Saliniradius amylolyticus]|uniref:Uncharacterized protein n=1 Tax=Saliniradius amylolyticus TaxID=2183582 RepID=A0A2S2E0F3_9ALTE|nr:hypothetical protein [Saliniradius amylolyticus]AWL10760.1 hypothetical protein HMF8227_00252 [Saliniradius amylolyticus]